MDSTLRITAGGGNQDNEALFGTCADWISPGNGRRFEYRYNPPAVDGRKVILTDSAGARLPPSRLA